MKGWEGVRVHKSVRVCIHKCVHVHVQGWSKGGQ